MTAIWISVWKRCQHPHIMGEKKTKTRGLLAACGCSHLFGWHIPAPSLVGVVH